MRLSIIVPVYNCTDFLPQLAVTIAALPGEAYEVILVDDGSTDGSGAFCDEISSKNSHVKVLHKQNGGVSSARNLGLDAASGHYIGFLDADDAVKPYMYERLMESAQKYGSDMVMGGYEKVDGIKRTKIAIPFDEVLDTESEILNIVWSMAFWNAWVDGCYRPTLYGSVWPNLYRKDLIQANQIRFPEGIAIGEDLLFNLEYLSYVKRLSVVNEPLYVYNVANTSATRKQNKNLWQRYCVLMEKEKEMLLRLYGSDNALEYNLHRQRINYAINVGEEQFCVFMEKHEAKRALRELCSDTELRKAAEYILKYGKTAKERFQAALIRGKFAGLIWIWLK